MPVKKALAGCFAFWGAKRFGGGKILQNAGMCDRINFRNNGMAVVVPYL